MKKPVPCFNAQIAQASHHWADFQEEVGAAQEEEHEANNYYCKEWDWWWDEFERSPYW